MLIILVLSQIILAQIQYQKGTYYSSSIKTPLNGNTLSSGIVQFNNPFFQQIPKILLSYNSLDGLYNAGFHIFASEITQQSFKINYNILTTSQIVALNVDWLAIVHDGVLIYDFQFSNLEFPIDYAGQLEYTLISTFQVKNSGNVVPFMNGFSQNSYVRYLKYTVTIINDDLIQFNMQSNSSNDIEFFSIQFFSMLESINWNTFFYNFNLNIAFQEGGSIDQQIFQIQYPTEFLGQPNIVYFFGIRRFQITDNYRLHLKTDSTISTSYLQFIVEIWGSTLLDSLQINFLFFSPKTIAYKFNAFDSKYFPICGDSIKTIYEECDDFTPQCKDCQQQCDYNCHTSLGDVCLVCKEGFQLILNQCFYIYTPNSNLLIEQQYPEICDFNCQLCTHYSCLSCKEGYILSDYKCHEYCSSVNVLYWEKECDDFNNLQFDGCYECRFQCDFNCLICQYGKCLQCSVGYYPEGSDCISKCGDLVVSGSEQCDDQNTTLFDGCYNCQYQCQNSCDECILGNCLKCTSGWYLSLNKCFEPLCGDIIIQGIEECDDGNNIQFDGCFNCKLECDINCQSCIGGFCYKCYDGWHLTNSQSCESKCGDGIVVKPQEECDDGNNEKYDGCYNCLYQCEINCSFCGEGLCDLCYEGYQLNYAGICQTVCGDGIIMGLEECDDGNDDSNDDCDNCQTLKNDCDPTICDLCIKNECIICETGYYANENVCISKCGDGILIESFEQCDDNNIISGDGCSEYCIIETGYICVQLTISQCAKYDSPQMYLTKQKLSNYESLVIVKFTQFLKLQSKQDSSNLVDQLTISLDQVDKSFFITDLVVIQTATNKLNDVEYQFKIKFLQSVIKPKVFVNVNVGLSNQYDNVLLNTQASIILDSAELLNFQQLELAQTSLDIGKYQIYILLAIIGLSIITLNLDIFLNCLDIIQYLSYLQYINFKFPANLELFFNSFQQVQVGYYLNPYFITIKYDVEFTNNTLSAGKFVYYQLTPNIGVNLYGILIIYCVNLIMVLIFQKLSQQVDKYYSQNFLQMSFRTTKIIYIIKKICYSMSRTSQLGIYILFTCNAYEILFACYLQLLQQQDQYIRMMQGRQLIAFIILQIYLVNALKYFEKIKYFKQTKHIVCYGINANGSYWQLQSNNIALLKKMVFLFGITMCQDEGVIAIALIMLTQMIEVLFIWYQNPFSQVFKEIVVGILTICVILSLLAYSKNWKQMSYQQKIFYGWITIGGLVLILTFQIIIDSIQGVTRIVKYFKKKAQIKKQDK